MSITKIFWLWLIVWVVFFGLAALINGAGLLSLIFGYSIMSVIAAFLCTLIHFGVQQFLKKDSITPSLRSQHPDTHNTTNAPKITSDRIQNIIDNLLDEAVKAASQSEWAEVARICGEVTNLDDDNSEAARLLKAAEANLKQVVVVPTTAKETTVRSSFIPLADRAKWAQITVGITVAALLVSIFSDIYEINFIYYLMNWDSLSWMEQKINQILVQMQLLIMRLKNSRILYNH